MSEAFSYLKESEFFIRQASFYHMGGRHSGSGWLRWNPERGARIDVAATRSGPPLPKQMTIGYVGWLKPEHYTSIRMQIDGFDWVVAPRVGLVDRLDLIVGDHLSVDVPRVIWCQESRRDELKGFAGHITLALHEKVGLFSILEESVLIEGEELRRRFSRDQGILAEVDGLKIRGTLDYKHRVRISWSDSESTLSRANTWGFGLALRTAVSLCAQCQTPVLERQLSRGKFTYRELRPVREPKRPVGLQWFSPLNTPSAEECLKLALRLNTNPKLQAMAWGVFSQLVESTRQSAWGSSELLVALILEGILRTFDDKPFADGKKYNPQGPMKRLHGKHFPSVTKQQCQEALAAHRRLRHRNAHPDWLSAEQRFGLEQLEMASKDMTFLSRMYGRMIFESAGLPSIANKIELESV